MSKLKITIDGTVAYIKAAIDLDTVSKMYDVFTIKMGGKQTKLFDYAPPGLKTHFAFAPGIVTDVASVLRDRGYRTEVEDRRDLLKLDPKKVSKQIDSINDYLQRMKGFKLRHHQCAGIMVAVRNPFSALEIATGGGKSLMIASLAYIYGLKTLVLVDGIDLMRQMAEDLTAVLNKDAIGTIGGGINNSKQVDVGIIDSMLLKARALRALDYEYIIIDETHLAASNQYTELIGRVKELKAMHCVTGTWLRSDRGEQLALKAATGDCVYRISPSFLIERKHLPKPKIIMVKGRHSTKKGRSKAIDGSMRNSVAATFIRHHYKKGNTVLAMTTMVKHAEGFADRVKMMGVRDHHIMVATGVHSKDHRYAAVTALSKRQIRVLVATKIFEKGINIPSVDAGVNLKGEETEIGCRQSIGRILRGNGSKEYLDYYDTYPPNLEKTSARRLAIYQSESGFDVEVITMPEFVERYRT